jgi:ubiquitin carboxyl-terminal hydrolase L3
MAITDDARWLPLESNPESMNKWAKSLGAFPPSFLRSLLPPSTSPSSSSPSPLTGLKTEGEGAYTFQDVFGLEPECLDWVKQPVKAVLMLFPVTEGYEKMRKAQDEKVLEDGVEGVADVIYFKQTSALSSPFFPFLFLLSSSPLLYKTLWRFLPFCFPKSRQNTEPTFLQSPTLAEPSLSSTLSLMSTFPSVRSIPSCPSLFR